jgi:hypothetical protein
MPKTKFDLRTAAAAEHGAAVHVRLRDLLKKEFGQEQALILAGAMFYEVTSIVATMSATEDQAYRLIRDSLDVAEEQIDKYGVGKPHP